MISTTSVFWSVLFAVCICWVTRSQSESERVTGRPDKNNTLWAIFCQNRSAESIFLTAGFVYLLCDCFSQCGYLLHSFYGKGSYSQRQPRALKLPLLADVNVRVTVKRNDKDI